MKWLACELHTHTVHSDGKQTLLELALGAKRLGFDCIALTDHNTMSGLQGKEEVEKETGIAVLPGMEWTTFYGHMVTVGLETFVDWRKAEPNTIHASVAGVHEQGGVAGLAHPFRIGTPVCTGCFWEFNIRDWNDFDYIEVWSTTFAPVKQDNQRAFALWTKLLNEGVRIAATSGRDWHRHEETEDPLSVTYLGLREEESASIQESAVNALKEGRVAVTIGPLVTMEVCSEAGEAAYGLGAAVPAGHPDKKECYTSRVRVSFSVREGMWQLPAQSYRLVVNGSEGGLAEMSIGAEDNHYEIGLGSSEKRPVWIRAELWGNVRGVHALIAFTNAIYFDREAGYE
ncbi:CehA/McbA family metallohydrolase [Paenibacillus sp. GCM10027626]|uniref:CehA/McbA family metallohydrolase n=1 Tax=Paenibacillus sp. GCM10027626 TaxID=3273411 RepID=UPI0036308933